MRNTPLELSRDGLKSLEKKVAQMADREQRLAIITDIRNKVEDVLAQHGLITIDEKKRGLPIGRSQALAQRSSSEETFFHFNKIYGQISRAENRLPPLNVSNEINLVIKKIIEELERQNKLSTAEENEEDTTENPFNTEALWLFINEVMGGIKPLMRGIEIANSRKLHPQFEILLDLVEVVPDFDARRKDSGIGDKIKLIEISGVGGESRQLIEAELKKQGIHVGKITAEQAATFRKLKRGHNPAKEKRKITEEVLQSPLKVMESLEEIFSPIYGGSYYGVLKTLGCRNIEDVIEQRPILEERKVKFIVKVKKSLLLLLAEEIAKKEGPDKVVDKLVIFEAGLLERLKKEGIPIGRTLEKEELDACIASARNKIGGA